MGQLYLPPLSPLAKAARGWPSSPHVKPRIPVEIDWGNPYAQGLSAAYINIGSGFLDLVSKRYETDTAFSPAGGDVYYSDNSPTGRAVFSANYPLQPSSEISVLAVVNPDLSTEDNGIFIVGDLSTGWKFICWLDESSNQLRLGGGVLGDFAYGSSNSVSAGEWQALIYSRKASGFHKFFRDGAKTGADVSASSDTIQNTGSIDNRPWQRPSAGSTSLQGYGRILFIWKRQLSDSESEYLTKNPYAFLKPANQSPYLVGLPSATGAPTLSLPTYSNVTADSATVGCTVTF